MGGCQSGHSGDILSNSSSNKSNMDSVRNIINQHSNTSTAKISTNQVVSIKQDDDYDDSLIKMKCYDYNFLGMKMGEYQPYGAEYNITQTSGLKLVQINSDISKEVDNIYNKVVGKLQSDLNASIGSSQGKNAARDAINDASAQTKRNLTSYLNQIANKTIDQQQKIEIIAKRPFRFDGNCGDFKNPEIKQELMIDVVAQNIISIIVSDIEKKLVSQENSGKIEYDSTGGDLSCELQMAMGVICCIICLLIAWVLYQKFGKGKEQEAVEVLGSGNLPSQ